jgi:hypothetical protein
MFRSIKEYVADNIKSLQHTLILDQHLRKVLIVGVAFSPLSVGVYTV